MENKLQLLSQTQRRFTLIQNVTFTWAHNFLFKSLKLFVKIYMLKIAL